MNTKTIHPDQYYIDALLTNDRRVINTIYQKFSGKVKAYILNNSGDTEDAADIFQETLIDLYQQAKYKGLQLTCPFEPFLILLCKRKWLNHLKKRSITPVTNKDASLLYNVGEDTFRAAEISEREREQMDTYLSALNQLGERCRELIKETLSGEAQEKIAERLKITYAYLRKKKSECMASLIKLIKSKKEN